MYSISSFSVFSGGLYLPSFDLFYSLAQYRFIRLCFVLLSALVSIHKRPQECQRHPTVLSCTQQTAPSQSPKVEEEILSFSSALPSVSGSKPFPYIFEETDYTLYRLLEEWSVPTRLVKGFISAHVLKEVDEWL